MAFSPSHVHIALSRADPATQHRRDLTPGGRSNVAIPRRLTALARAEALLLIGALSFHPGETRAQALTGQPGQQQLLNVRERTDTLSNLGAQPSQDIPPHI